jgi:hypothetical protein
MAVMSCVLPLRCEERDEADDELARLADFKWLMVPHGLRIDLPRVIRDRCYARQCLEQARLTPSALVRRAAERVLPPLC